MKLNSQIQTSINFQSSSNDDFGGKTIFDKYLSGISVNEVKTIVDFATKAQQVCYEEIAVTLLAELEILLCVQGCILGIYHKNSAESKYYICTLMEKSPVNINELFTRNSSCWPFYFEDKASPTSAYLYFPYDNVVLGHRQQMILEIILPYLYAGVKRLYSFYQRIVELNLTSREQEVMRWIIAGKDNWSIGKILGVSERTIKYHSCNIYRKLGVNTRAQAISLYLSVSSEAPNKILSTGMHNKV
jgi:DNA-binding CsgD family transcriptional regulator